MKHDFKHDESILFLFATAHWKIHKVLNKRIRESGFNVTPDQWLILLNLWHDGLMYQSQIAKSQHKDRAAVKRLLDRLEKEELVERNKNASDLRKVGFQLTEKGEHLVLKINELSTDTFSKTVKDLSEIELNALKRFIRRINKFIK